MSHFDMISKSIMNVQLLFQNQNWNVNRITYTFFKKEPQMGPKLQNPPNVEKGKRKQEITSQGQ